MSRDDFVEIVEVLPNHFSVKHGMGEDKGQEFLYTDDLRLAIKEARKLGTEYGPYFSFLEDQRTEEGLT